MIQYFRGGVILFLVFLVQPKSGAGQNIDSLVVRITENSQGSNAWDYQSQIVDSFKLGKRQSTVYRNWDVYHWKNNIWHLFSYDGSGNITNNTMLVWDSTGWHNSTRTLNTYVAGNRILTELNQKWNTGAWINDNQTLHHYNSNNLDTLVLTQTWKISSWANSSMVNQVFDNNNFLTNATTSNFDSASAAWKPQSRLLHTPAGNGFDTEVITQYFTADSTWDDFYREVYSYDASDKKTSLNTYYASGNPGSPWDPFNQISYNYDSLGQLTSFTDNCQGACGYAFGTLSYDSLGRLETTYNYSESMGGNITESKQHWYYLDYPNSSSLFVFLPADFERCSADPLPIGAFVLGGSGRLSYHWTPSAGLNSDTVLVPVSSSDSTINYLVDVVDSTGNSAAANITVSVLQSPVASIFIQNIDTLSSCNSALLSTDSTSWLFCSWYRNNILQTNPYGYYASHFPIVQNGNYVVRVENWEGCRSLDTIQFNYFGHPAPSVGLNSHCNQIIANCPTAQSFQWYQDGIAIANATNDTLNVTANGDYKVVIQDQLGCTSASNQMVFHPMYMNMNVGSTCSGECQGFATAIVYNSVTPNQYHWTTGDSTSSINNLCQGMFTVTVTDSRGCTVNKTDSVTNFNDFPAYNIISSTVTGPGLCDGAAFVNFPSPAYYPFFTYLWNDSSTSYVNTVCEGWNYIRVKSNFHQCIRVDSFFVNSNPANTNCDAAFTEVKPHCIGLCDGSLMVTGTGTGTINYLWINPAGSRNTSITNICPGTYSVIIIDGGGCVDTGEVVLSAQDSMVASFSILSASPSQPCSTLVNAAITNGTPPYAIDWCGLTSQNPAYLCPGNCTLTVQDIFGCTSQINYIVPDSIVACSYNAVVNQVSASGVCDGSIALSLLGTPPFSINWMLGATDSVLQNLCAGTYVFTSVDSNGCTVTDSIIVGTTGPVGIQNTVPSNTLLVYPNPGHNDIHIELPEHFSIENYVLKIFDSQGRLIYSAISVNKIPVAQWPAGLYEVFVQTEKMVLKTRWAKD